MSDRQAYIAIAVTIVVLAFLLAVALGPDAAQDCASDAVKFKTGCR